MIIFGGSDSLEAEQGFVGNTEEQWRHCFPFFVPGDKVC